MDRVELICGNWSVQARVARSFLDRWRGLRPDGSAGPMIIPGASVHGRGMKIELWVMALDRGLVVLSVDRLRPGGLVRTGGAGYMLELLEYPAPGVGDRLSIVSGCLVI